MNAIPAAVKPETAILSAPLTLDGFGVEVDVAVLVLIEEVTVDEVTGGVVFLVIFQMVER